MHGFMRIPREKGDTAMETTFNIDSKIAATAALVAELDGDLSPTQQKGKDLLSGKGLSIMDDRSFLAGFDTRDVSVQAMVSSWIDQKFEAMKQVAKNMGVTEEEREEAERRLKELEELRKKLQDQEIDFKEALKKFETLGISAGDKAALEMAVALEKPAYV